MIPSIIHYCWFGGNPIPDDAKQYIATWRKFCPDYEIKEWNEQNFDLNTNDYCKEAYEEKKWAFVADYVRLKVLEKYGGIYMDTDVEIVKSFDNLLCYHAFMCFEEKKSVSIGTIGVEKNSKMIKDFLNAYLGRHFRRRNSGFDTTTNLKIVTPILVRDYGLNLNGKKQILNSNILVLPMEGFIAKDFLTGWIFSDDTTYAIHHYAASWYSEERRRYMQKHQYYSRVYMRKAENIIGKMASFKVYYEVYGWGGVIMKIIKYITKQSGDES